MDSEDLLQFVNKDVGILMKNEWSYKGRIKRINNDSIVLFEAKLSGDIIIALSEISTITEWKKEPLWQ